MKQQYLENKKPDRIIDFEKRKNNLELKAKKEELNEKGKLGYNALKSIVEFEFAIPTSFRKAIEYDDKHPQGGYDFASSSAMSIIGESVNIIALVFAYNKLYESNPTLAVVVGGFQILTNFVSGIYEYNRHNKLKNS